MDNGLGTNLYKIKQIRCIDSDGVELKLKEIKKVLKVEDVNELFIFGISNKLYKDILKYLDEEGISYYIYGRSRITIKK